MKIVTIYGLPGTGKSSALDLLKKELPISVVEESHRMEGSDFDKIQKQLNSGFQFRNRLQATGFAQFLSLLAIDPSLVVLDFLVDPEVSARIDLEAGFQVNCFKTCPKIYVKCSPKSAYSRWVLRERKGSLTYKDFEQWHADYNQWAKTEGHVIIEHFDGDSLEQLTDKLRVVLLKILEQERY